MDLTSYRTLGRSGLVVSPLALGTMTFGVGRWGADRAGSRAIYDAYVEAGGNFIDTADVYASGASEEMLGSFIAETNARDRIVLATKSGFPFERGHPHAGGNGAKHMRAALDGSLRRLATDHVDLYWVHVWDQVTPPEEVLGTLAGLVASGKVRHYGLSNVPAWYAAKIATLAAAHGLPAPIGLQFAYSLIDRGIEHEQLAMAKDCGMGLVPWSPLGAGFLTGRYDRESAKRSTASGNELPSGPATDGEQPSDAGRLSGPNPFGDTLFTETNWAILGGLRAVADEAGATMAAVALAWVVGRPGVASTLIGASRPEQVVANVAALGLELSSEHRGRLDAASAPATPYPFNLYSPAIRRMVFGGGVAGWGERTWSGHH